MVFAEKYYYIIGGKAMRRVLKKGMAVALAAAMVVTVAPVNNADAAKKPAFAKKSYSVAVKKSVTVKVKNAGKKKTVKWSTTKKGKKIVKLAKAKSKSNKKGVASLKVTGLKAGSAKITAKIGKKSCKVTVKVTAAVAATPTPTPSASSGTGATAAPSSSANASAAPSSTATASQQPGGDTPTSEPTKVPATKGPTATPRPTNTPSPAPKADPVSARKLGAEDKITADGNASAAEWENAGSTFDLLVNKDMSVRGETKVKEATAQFMWAEKEFYALVKTDVKVDKVTVFVDADNDATNKNAKKADAALSADGTVAEVKVDLDTALDQEKGCKIEVQINEGSSTINLFDSITDIVYDADKDSWSFKDNGIKAGSDDSVLGQCDLLGSMEQPTNAFYTDKGAEIITKAAIPDAWEFTADMEGVTDAQLAYKTKKMTFVDPSYWTDAYTANGSESTFFTKVNTDVYINNPDKIALAKQDEEGNWVSTRENAQAYMIWDKDYLYVLYDVNDPDVTEGNEDHYTCDSTEFFLDEDYSQPESYATDGSSDEVQLRVDAKNNAFSANDAGTGNYELVAHATNLKKTGDDVTGYQVEYIIKLHNEHHNGQIMGMELQINDCYTQDPTTDGETGEVTPGTPSRACSLSAYDTTNNCYQYPNYFGRIKLVNPAEKEVESTPEPTAEPTPEAPKYVATQLAEGTEVTIDGVEDASFAGIVAIPFSSKIGKKTDTDTKAEAKLAWDAKNLYGFVVVEDSDISAGNSSTHLNDGIEFFLDEDNDKKTGGYADNNPDAFQYRITGFTKDEDGNALPATKNEVDNGNKTDYTGIETAYTYTDKGYAVEFKIPFKADKVVDSVVGFDMIVQDCSKGDRDCEFYFEETEVAKSYWNNADAFGELKLVAAKAAVPAKAVLSAENLGTSTDNSEVVFEDGKAKLTLKADSAGHGVRFKLNGDEGIDLSKYKVVVNYTSKDAYPIYYTLEEDGSGSYWSYNANKLIGDNYGGLTAGSDKLTIDKGTEGIAKVLFFKYNTWVPEGQEARTDSAEVTIESIEFIAK